MRQMYVPKVLTPRFPCLSGFCLVTALLAPPVFGATVYVRQDGTGDTTTIQAGVDLAAAGDTVLVAAGTWTGPENRQIDFGGVDRVLLSESGAEATILDCEGIERAIFLHSGESAASVIDGFTVRNGWATYIEPGSAIAVSPGGVTIRNCVLEDNSGASAVYISGYPNVMEDALIEDCLFRNNQIGFETTAAGGALYCSYSGAVTIRRCQFWNNTANYGAAILARRCAPLVEISDCYFEGNLAGGGGSRAGAIHLAEGNAVLSDCEVLGSTRGGVHAWTATHPDDLIEIRDCDVHDNDLGVVAVNANLLVEDSSIQDNAEIGIDISNSGCSIRRCLLTGNGSEVVAARRSAVAVSYTDQTTTIEETTIADNPGRGIYLNSAVSPGPLVLTRSIVAGSGEGSGLDCVAPEPVVEIHCSDFWGNAGGDVPGCASPTSDYFSADPLFCDPPGGDYSLHPFSPCFGGNSPCGSRVGAFDLGCGPELSGVGYWRFEEDSGGFIHSARAGSIGVCSDGGEGTTFDYSGNGNHGYLQNGVLPDSSVPVDPLPLNGEPNNGSFYFDGIDDAICIPDAPSLRPQGAITIEAYIRAESESARVIVGKQILDATSNSYQLELVNGLFDFILSDSDGARTPLWYEFTRWGVWTHLAGTWDGETMRLYIDGCLVNSRPFDGLIGYDENPVIIGADDDGGGVPGNAFFFGQIDEVRISDRALAPGEFLNAGCTPVAVEEIPEAPRVALQLGVPTPNPFSSSVSFELRLSHSGITRIDLIDVGGRRVSRLYSGWLDAGVASFSWDGTDTVGRPQPSGSYWIRAQTGDEVRTEQVSLLRR